MDIVTDILPPTVTAKLPTGPTILGSELRRMTSAVVNGLSKGVFIEVKFLGTRAYTNGRRIVLPKIKDLAEIKYSTARALMGYAIHEVAHLRYTDFKAIARIFEDESIVAAFGTVDKMEIIQRQKLIKKFENCIEDYRIEREMTREYRGTKSDLEALRIAIHPRLKTLTTGWFADPRSCGPLALTWLGARINGFQNQHLQQSLDHLPAAVMALIDDWTERMTDVATTAGAVDLAIAFELEAQAFAKATREAADRLAAQKAADAAEAVPDDDGEQGDGSGKGDDAIERSTSDQDDPEPHNEAEGNPDTDTEESAETDAGLNEESSDSTEDRDPADKNEDRPADDAGPSEDGTPEIESSNEQQDVNSSDPKDGDQDQSPHNDIPDQEADADDQPSAGRDAAPAPFDDEAIESPNGRPDDRDVPESTAGDDLKFGSERREKQDSTNEVERRGAPQPSDRKRPVEDGEVGEVDLNRDLLDDYKESRPQPDEAGEEVTTEEQDPVDRIESQDDRETDAPKDGDAESPDDDLPETDGIDDGIGGGEEGGAFDDVLEDDARRDDAISDMIEEIQDRIAAGEPLPSCTPEASDGEIDPSTLLEDISDSNEDAPDYDSSETDPDPNDWPEEDTRANRSLQHYGDARFQDAPNWSEEGCRHADMQQKAAGAVSTTARTIKRLLMAEEKSGFLANRRSGDFDIRNVSAIARNTGTCYRRSWSRPAPKTLLVTLVDFSMSMKGNKTQTAELESPIAIAMTGALAIEQAVKGTSVNSAMYGYSGSSPTVNMTVFKEGRQSETVTKRRMGAFEKVSMNYTPTGEAMAAVAVRMDKAEEERRILLVLTDGAADDMQLCADVTTVLMRRGIEVVVIGIRNDSAESWAPVHKTIMNLGELPKALLSTIDPRANKKRMRRLAA